ncbi:MAG: glycosyltransferase [Candidatus Paceibacterota bacterium]|jgi:hypothetical protein
MLVYNKLDLCKNCIIHNLNNSALDNVEFLIWCNSQLVDVKNFIISLRHPKISKIFISDKNIGVSAYNHLIEQSKSNYILELDDDAIAPYEFDKVMVELYDTLPSDVGLLGLDMSWGKKTFATRYSFTDYTHYKNAYGDKYRIYEQGKADLIPGTCRMSRRELWTKCGGHPKVLYGSDLKVNKNALAHNFKTSILLTAKGKYVIHKPDPNTQVQNWKMRTCKIANKNAS